MATITAQANQTMIDVVINGMGTLEGASAFCELNDVGLSDRPVPGTVYELPVPVAQGGNGIYDYAVLRELANRKAIVGTLNAEPPEPPGPTPDPVTLWTIAESEGDFDTYAITPWRLTVNGTTAHEGDPQAIWDWATEVSYMATLSGLLDGTVSRVDDTVIYTPAPGEEVEVLAPDVLTKSFNLKVSGSASEVTDFHFQHAGGSQAESGDLYKMVISLASGAAEYVEGDATSETLELYEKTFPIGGGIRVVTIWHNDNVGALVWDGLYATTHTATTLLDAAGTLPALLEHIQFSDHPLLSSESVGPGTIFLPLTPCTGIQTIRVFNCTTITNLNYMMQMLMPALTTIDFSGNVYTSVFVDLFFARLWAHNWDHVSPLVIDISGHTPPAPPTSASLTTRNAILAAGGSITTD